MGQDRGSVYDRLWSKVGHDRIDLITIPNVDDEVREGFVRLMYESIDPAHRMSGLVQRTGNHTTEVSSGSSDQNSHQWRRWESNPRPPACKAGALAS